MGNNFIWYLICFLLGCIVFFIFPKDYHAPQYIAPTIAPKQDGDCTMSTNAGQSAQTQINCVVPTSEVPQ